MKNIIQQIQTGLDYLDSFSACIHDRFLSIFDRIDNAMCMPNRETCCCCCVCCCR